MRRLALAVLLGAAACSPSGGGGAAEKAPPLEGSKLGGGRASLAAFSGKVVLVDFWATWCDPCRAEVPELAKLHSRLADRGFAVLGVSMDEDTSAVAPFAKEMRVTYPVILLGSERPPDGWAVPGLPTAYLVARDGAIVKRYFGSKSAETLAADVQTALAR